MFVGVSAVVYLVIISYSDRFGKCNMKFTIARPHLHCSSREASFTFMNGASVPYLEVAIKRTTNQKPLTFIPHYLYSPLEAARNSDVILRHYVLMDSLILMLYRFFIYFVLSTLKIGYHVIFF